MMRKRITLLLLLFIALGVWSCRRESLPEIEAPVPMKPITVSASWASDETRTSIYQDDQARRYTFQWEAGDAISLVEVDGDNMQDVASEPLTQACDLASVSMALSDQETGNDLHYLAYYPVSAKPENQQASWNNGITIPLNMPMNQHPVPGSFDGAADLLVSQQVDLEARPEIIDISFARIGTILKLEVSGMESGTRIQEGTLNLGYACVGEIQYNAALKQWTTSSQQKEVTFSYSSTDSSEGQTGEELIADENGKATIWLRILSGVANRQVSLSLLVETPDGSQSTLRRNINLIVRNTSIHFKEGGLTSFSVDVSGTVPGDGVIPRDLQSVPTLKIVTRGGVAISDRTTWVPSTVSLVCDGVEKVIESDKGLSGNEMKAPTIRGRGNSTWGFPKKPYYLKFDSKQNLFGTPKKSKKYILLANWMDRTNLRNAVAFEAARRTSMEWAPKGMFVNLNLNGSNKGLYYLVEKIEVEEGRLEKKDVKYLYTVDVSDLNEAHFYINYGYSPNGYKRENVMIHNELPVEVKYPENGDSGVAWAEVLAESQSLFEITLKNAIENKTSAQAVDLDSFCDWYLVHELFVNLEPNHPKSCYLYYKNDGKFYAGPAWDFDWGTFVLDKTGWQIQESLFYKGLFKDPAFVAKLKERWGVLRSKFESLGDYIDAQADWIRSSEVANHALWPIETGHGYTGSAITANGDQTLEFQPAVDRMKTSIGQRISAIDTAIEAL